MSISKKKVLFIINPRAGVDRVKALQEDIDHYIDHDLFSIKLVYTEHAKHGVALAREGVAKGANLVVAVGGDGSVNDIVHGLYGSDVAMGIIPKGSGNGLARSLKIPLDQREALKRLNKFSVKHIDVGSADGHLFVSNAGVGFDTVVTKKFEHSQKRGFKAYISIILKSIWSYEPKLWQVEADGAYFETQSFMLTAANAIQLGYGFKVAPEADITDGYFELVNIKKFPKILASNIAIRAFTGGIKSSPYVSIKRAKNIKISHPNLKQLQIDGESLSCSSEILIKMMPKQLKVLV